MNKFQFFQSLILHYLYTKDTVSTNEIEEKFGSNEDIQDVNNVVCDRSNLTSYIHKGYMDYDEAKRTLTITAKGKQFIEEKYN